MCVCIYKKSTHNTYKKENKLDRPFCKILKNMNRLDKLDIAFRDLFSFHFAYNCIKLNSKI